MPHLSLNRRGRRGEIIKKMIANLKTKNSVKEFRVKRGNQNQESDFNRSRTNHKKSESVHPVENQEKPIRIQM